MPRGRADGGADANPGLIYGRHPVREALRARRRSLKAMVLREGLVGADIDALRTAALEVGVPVDEMSSDAFRRAVPEGANTQGVLLRVGALPSLELEALVPDDGPCTLVALDGVEDPQNLGAIARVAEAAGVAGIILTHRRSAPLGAAASRASAGALEWLSVARVPNLVRALKTLKEMGFWVYGADSGEAGSLYQLPARAIDGRRVLVLGAEGHGLREGVLGAVDHRVRIPMAGEIGSLNVASAAAIILFELSRRGSELAEV